MEGKGSTDGLHVVEKTKVGRRGSSGGRQDRDRMTRDR